MFKNVASQKLTLLAIDTTTSKPKAGDAANITAYLSQDDGTVTALTDTSAAELDATNAKGLYTFDLTQAETNADKIVFSAKSSTSDIEIVPLLVYTVPPSFNASALATAAALATVDGIVDDILLDTAVIGSAGAGLTAVPWNASWDAEVQSEVDDALIAKGLDHLVYASVTGTDVADDSIIAKLVSKSATADWDSYTNTTDSQEALRDRGDGAWVTATGFSTHSASDVWAVGTRVLTAGTNIELVKGTGVTGFNDLSAAQVNSEVDTAIADVGLTSTITGRIDAAVSTRLASGSYTAPDNSSITAIKAKTDTIPANPAAVGSAMTLADGAVTDAKFTVPTLTGPATGPVGYLYQLWRLFFKKTILDRGAQTIKTYADDGTTEVTEQTYTNSTGVETRGPAT